MGNGCRVRVLVVDDHAIVRRGLRTFLDSREDIEVIGEASDGREAIQTCQEMQPDVVLLDLLMPGMDGVATTRMIHQCCPEIQIIILTSFQERKLVQEALAGGAIGYLLKNVSGDELAQSILRAYAGRPTLAPEAVRALVDPPPTPPPVGEDLTTRELEVLTLLAKGIHNPQIAHRLVISPTTVKSHISSILSKLGVSSRCEAVSLAIQKRLINI